MWAAIISFILPVALWVLEQFFLGDKENKESRELYLKIIQYTRIRGVNLARSRFEDMIRQDLAGEAEWLRRDKT